MRFGGWVCKQVNELPSQMLCLALSIITIATSRHYVQGKSTAGVLCGNKTAEG